MAHYEDENKPAYAREMSEPLHERVAVLEKLGRELGERVHELSAELERFISRVSRELNL